MSKKFLADKYKKNLAADAFAALETEADDMIYLNIGDPDINTPKIVLDAAFADAYRGYTKYTNVRGYRELRSEICDFYRNRYNMPLKDSQVCVTTSGQMAMWCACQAVLNSGDEVIIPRPYFPPYKDAVEMAGGVPVYVKCNFDEGFQINVKNLEKTLTKKTKAIIINNPNNPTGAVYSKETLTALADFAIRNDILVLSDEIYTSFAFDKPFIPLASLEGMWERTVTINSGSKNFVMTGMRIGNLVADEDIVSAVAKVCENTVYSPPTISQRAMLHAFRNFDKFEKSVADTFRQRVKYAHERLKKFDYVKILPLGGTFYLYPNIEASGLDGEEFSNLLQKECHIKVIPGTSFGPGGKYNFRISCTVSTETLKRAFDRMEKLKF
jgi:aspartate/methionine/tyrosine aminotransferase